VLVQDVAAAMISAIETAGIEGRTFNLAGDVRPTAREFIAELTHRSRRLYQFYPRALWQLMMVEEAKWLLKAAARRPENPFPSSRDMRSRSLRAPLDCSSARKLLGWTPVSDREEFYRLAIDVNIRPIPLGDLRSAEMPV
jgi:nucleoside-diphosphate-sugar epimerase